MLQYYGVYHHGNQQSQVECAVMGLTGDLIKVLIEGKEHLFMVNEHKSANTITVPTCGESFSVCSTAVGRHKGSAAAAARGGQ